MKFEIKHCVTGSPLFTSEFGSFSLALEAAVKAGADLRGADLRGADLHRAYLREADLCGADLYGANLRGAYLREAGLCGANLREADLRGANLYAANLYAADLREADLHEADLRGADLHEADLHGVKGAELAIARTRILPEGDLVGWKKCPGNVIVKLRIPADAKRSHAFGRKCRAEFADVLEVIGAESVRSEHDPRTIYRAGERVFPDAFDEDWMRECASGIHFFITRAEAEDY